MKKLNAALAILGCTLALSMAGAAHAGELTRADVTAQLQAARRSGESAALNGEDSGSAYLKSHYHGSEPRAEVKAELAEARADGSLDALTAENSGSDYLIHQEHTSRSRADVKADLLAARNSGELDALDGEDSGSFYLSHKAAAGNLGTSRIAMASQGR
ncbi:MAG: hypothetical protein JWP52_2342 [Rhizobacter sp.]|nr:hypothetical protein [Rhizobacter sp.]